MFESLVERASKKNPLSLADIMFEYDRLERLNPSQKELQDIVTSFFNRGLITEVAPGRYAKRTENTGSKPRTPISEEMYKEALAEKHRWFEEYRQSKE